MKIFNLLQSYLDPVTNKMKYFQLKQAHKSYLSFKILKIYTHVLFILICWNKILVSNRTIQPICFTDVKATLTLFICMLFTKCYSLLRQKHFIIFNEIPYIHFCHCHKTMIYIIIYVPKTITGNLSRCVKKKEPDTKKTRVTLTGSINMFF